MNIFKYVRDKGVINAINVVYKYHLEIIIEKIICCFVNKKPLKNIIIIESHNDFDCNGGAFYNYLIEHNYNKKYKIVWLVRYKDNKILPQNVECVPLFGPSIKKAWYICNAKYFTFDSMEVSKPRDNQIMVYCSHGAGGLKSIKGLLTVSDRVNYLLVQSYNYAPIQAEQWSLEWPNNRIVSIGYPVQDILFSEVGSGNEISKITSNKYKKVILWMPTFRKISEAHRNDSNMEFKYGIPLINSLEEFNKLNIFLQEKNILLVLKIHPKQDLSDMKLKDESNIIILTGQKVKEYNIDNYRLMKDSDALISDYSGVTYDYLQLNRPIGYILDDMNEYKNGFVIDNIHDLIAGQEIYSLLDMEEFIESIYNNIDKYKNKREYLRDYIYEYHDGNSSERLAKLLEI